MTFGENIKRIRKEKKMSQHDLGLKLGVKQQTVAQYEKAKNTPKLETVRRLAEALGVTISDLNPDWASFTPDEIFEDMCNHELEYENINPRQIVNDNRLLEKFHALNYAGQEKAIEHLNLLTQISSYINDDNNY